MSKMRMPEMSVVRFNERDVIVASDGYYTLHKTNDTAGWNMTFTDPDGNYIVKNTQQGGVPYDNQFGDYTQLTFHNGGSNLTLYTLINMDSSDVATSSNGFDGNYTYDSVDNSFRKQ